MKEKALKKLNRNELLELLLAQTKNNERLQEELSKANAKLADRRVRIENAGDLATAMLSVNGVVEAAEAAVRQYLENIEAMERETRERCDDLLSKAEKEAEEILKKAEEEAQSILAAAEKEAKKFQMSREKGNSKKGKKKNRR